MKMSYNLYYIYNSWVFVFAINCVKSVINVYSKINNWIINDESTTNSCVFSRNSCGNPKKTYVIVNAVLERHNKTKTKLMVDSGSKLSYITFHKIKEEICTNVKQVQLLESISAEGGLKIYGLFKMRFKINDAVLEHPFHIVSGRYFSGIDGLIGMDFLRKHKVSVDYSAELFRFQFNNAFVTWKLY